MGNYTVNTFSALTLTGKINYAQHTGIEFARNAARIEYPGIVSRPLQGRQSAWGLRESESYR